MSTPAPRAPLPTAAELTVPASIAERWDVLILSGAEGCGFRAAAAALGLCWPRFRRRHPYGGNALRYGGEVLDTLASEGYSLSEISVAADVAAGLIADNLPRIEGAADFSKPPVAQDGTPSGGGSTSAST